MPVLRRGTLTILEPFATNLCLTLIVCLAWLVYPANANQVPDWVARHGLTSKQYQNVFTNLVNKGYRLKVVSGYTSGGQERYAALWLKTASPKWTSRHGMSSTYYQKAFNYYLKRGYRLVYVCGYAIKNKPRFAAIWEKSSGPSWVAHHGLTSKQYQSVFTNLVNKGYRLQHVSGYTVKEKDFYAAIWDKSTSPPWVARHGLTASQYQQAFNDFSTKGYRLKVVSGYQVGAKDRYAALWEKTTGPLFAARHGIKGTFYQNIFDNFYYQGYQPVYVNAFASGNAVKFNGIWENTRWKGTDLDLIASKVQAYMDKHSIPGLSIAVTKDSRLVYASGFGKADKSTSEDVSPNHLFRIASVSKPITSMTIFQLIEQGKISLDDRVFGPNSLLGAQYPTPNNNKKIERITVRQLLQHISGFTNLYKDPMFQHTDYSQDQLINWALENNVPQNNAGTVYEYSNFGYCILGRVIENVTSQSYETYVINNVLKGVDIKRMVIGGNSLSERKSGEVVYYSTSAYDPYDLNVRRFDSHGGWIAAPIDLMRFMVHVDGLSTKPDIIKTSSYTTMTTKSGISDADGIDRNYACGWMVGNGFQRHNGAMPGTLCWMTRASNGFGYAVATNLRPEGDQFANELGNTLNEIIANVSTWPAYDLF